MAQTTLEATEHHHIDAQNIPHVPVIEGMSEHHRQMLDVLIALGHSVPVELSQYLHERDRHIVEITSIEQLQSLAAEAKRGELNVAPDVLVRRTAHQIDRMLAHT